MPLLMKSHERITPISTIFLHKGTSLTFQRARSKRAGTFSAGILSKVPKIVGAFELAV
jgi:hypothetical protein